MRRAFVITVAALATAGCEEAKKASSTATTVLHTTLLNAKSTQADHPDHKNPPPPKIEGAEGKRKRVVRHPLPAYVPLGRAAIGGQAMNPRDADGRPLYASADGHCYVQIARAGRMTLHGRDCPDELMHPAWDACIEGRMRKLEDGACFCRKTGNPPPPEALVDCPD